MIDPVVSINYMLGGYAAISIVLTAYLISLVVRWRNLKRDLKALDEIEKKP